MNGRPSSWGTSGNPLLQALSLLVFGLLLIGAVVMGAVILAVVLGLAVIGALAFYARFWWLSRKMRGSAPARGGESAAGKLIEAEYTVVEERDPAYPNDRRPRVSPRDHPGKTAGGAGESDDPGRSSR
jgi:hypothetical protein